MIGRLRKKQRAGIIWGKLAKRFHVIWWLAPIIVAWLLTPCPAQYALPSAVPTAAGVDDRALAPIEPMIASAIERGDFPGCVVLLVKDGQVFYQRAFGNRRLEPAPQPMTVDTVFDMASITKPVATATSIMRLVELGQVRLADPLANYLPGFEQNGKENISVFQCLTHQAGFVPDSPLSEYEDAAEIWPNLYALGTQYQPGTDFVYSDVGYQFLGRLVEQVSEKPLQDFARDHIFLPLEMRDTGFLPAASLRDRLAPTEKRNDQWMLGEVHDPRAYAMGGVAGHAGLFSTARDLARYGQMMLERGQLGGQRILSTRTVDVMTDAYRSGPYWRGLGWDKRSKYSTNRGDLFTDQAFGHGGFTGTVLWIDPGLNLIMIVLSNRLHPDGEGTVNDLAGRIANVVVAAIRQTPQRADGDPLTKPTLSETLCGIDVLQRDRFVLLEGRRVGLILNHTARDRAGRLTSNILQDASKVHLVCLFSPEHGIAGALDQSTIDDATDEATKLPIHSLYGARRAPTADQLAPIDTLVFDIQDIGTRFYTYISTMGNAMRAAAEHGVQFVVLDRPNPIGGVHVAGPVLDAGRESFVGFHTLPVRHGMTAGELAKLFQRELELDIQLEVVPVEGWRRSAYWDATGLTWINPSPNMRTPHQALLYPGIGLLETTNLSVGRGTDTPFELVGAPWINAITLASQLNQQRLPGIRCVPVTFTPTSSKYADQPCQGVRFLITDRARLRPVEFGLALACALRDLHDDVWQLDKMDRLLCDAAIRKMLKDRATLDQITAAYQAELADFRIRRAACLIYE